MSTSLLEKKCLPCSGETPPLKNYEIEELKKQLDQRWKVEGFKLACSFPFDNFLKPMRFAKRVADIAEEQQHHPDLIVRWGELKIDLWTHAINGLSEADFILAAKIDKAALEESIK
jgi:4a-hydroxytetrahydrobiopterin dehydratase